MIANFNHYLERGHVKKRTPDPEEAKSLLKKAETRLNYFKSKEITEEDDSIIFENIYGSIREAAQSLMSIKGYKPYSHEATISFLKEFYKNNFTEEEINKFDGFRSLRSDSEYRAIHVSKEDAESCLTFAETFIEKIKSIYDALSKLQLNKNNKEGL